MVFPNLSPMRMMQDRKEKMQTNQIVKDDELFERLRALRRKLAQEQGVPPFVVFSDETLREMSGKVPLTDEEGHKRLLHK